MLISDGQGGYVPTPRQIDITTTRRAIDEFAGNRLFAGAALLNLGDKFLDELAEAVIAALHPPDPRDGYDLPVGVWT
jgi:hypothetical protein